MSINKEEIKYRGSLLRSTEHSCCISCSSNANQTCMHTFNGDIFEIHIFKFVSLKTYHFFKILKKQEFNYTH